MAVNADAIHGTSPNPWPYEFAWGRVTVKGNKLYLLVTDWAQQIELYGLRSAIKSASLLAAPEQCVAVEQTGDTVRLTLPATAPDPLVSVVALEFDGALDVDASIFQQSNGNITLPAYLAEIGGGLTLSTAKLIDNWTTTEGSLKWQFKLREPGKYAVRMLVGSHYQSPEAAAGHHVSASVAGQEVSGVTAADETTQSPRTQHFPEYVTTLGEVELPEAGTLTLTLSATEIGPSGMMAAGVQLVPVK
jgi:alpha-L-fucosidase